MICKDTAMEKNIQSVAQEEESRDYKSRVQMCWVDSHHCLYRLDLEKSPGADYIA